MNTIRDLAAAVSDYVSPLVTRAELEEAVRAERTERFEDHDTAAVSALAARVIARIEAADAKRAAHPVTTTVTEAGRRALDGSGSVQERAVKLVQAADWAGLLALARRARNLRLSAARCGDSVGVHVGYGTWCIAVVEGCDGHIGLGGYKLIEQLVSA